MNFFPKIISRIRNFPKKNFLLLGFFIIFLSLPIPTMAGLGDIVVGGLGILSGSLVVIFYFAFLSQLSYVFVWISGLILKWVTSEGFISVSYTNPSGPDANPIIKAGLDITKGFVNLALVVVLIYIALVIALKLGTKEISAKKLFVKFLLVALLVNFAPLVVGIIVDASNIIMNYFLGGCRPVFDLPTTILPWSENILSLLYKVVSFSGQISLLARASILLILNLLTGLALLLFAVIFSFRYIAIWVLVILSPLAFVAWILPGTKKFWDMWWQNLIQWSFIGIPLAFFLYLAAQVFSQASYIFKTQATMPGVAPEVVGVFNESFPFFVVIAFLFLGFAVGLATSAVGASSIISGIKSGTKFGSKWLGKKVGKGVGSWLEEKTRFREGVKKVVEFGEKVPLARALMPEKVRLYAEFGEALSKAQEKAKHLSSVELGHRVDVGADYGKQATANILEMIERGDSEDLLKPSRKRYAKEIKEIIKKTKEEKKIDISEDEALSQVGAFREKMKRFIQIGYQGGKGNGIVRGDPRLARFAVGIGAYKDVEDEHKAVQKATNEARSQHISHWEKEVTMDEEVIEYGMERGRDFWQAVQSNVKAGHEEPLKTIAKIYNKSGAKDWDEFSTWFKDRHEGKEGFFQYMGGKEGKVSQRAMEQGWTPDRIKEIAKKLKKEEEKKKEAPKTTVPGEKLGVKPPGGGAGA